jgi:hypothetical protein
MTRNFCHWVQKFRLWTQFPSHFHTRLSQPAVTIQITSNNKRVKYHLFFWYLLRNVMVKNDSQFHWSLGLYTTYGTKFNGGPDPLNSNLCGVSLCLQMPVRRRHSNIMWPLHTPSLVIVLQCLTGAYQIISYSEVRCNRISENNLRKWWVIFRIKLLENETIK